MTQKRLTLERGQFFWYIKEVVIDGFPDLIAKHSKFDPEKEEHKKLVKSNNYFLTEDDAYDSLAS